MGTVPEKNPAGISTSGLRAVPAVRVDLHPGDRFAERYIVERLLGRGGMGEVWLATQEPLGRRVAVKVLRPPEQVDDDPNFDQRFLREAAASSRLGHPNVVTVHDFGQTLEGALYIVMEHLDGRDLRTTLNHEGAMAPLRALHIARQVARALRDAHSHGIVHRDLKPANVLLVRRDDDPDFVKVLDFGLVKFADDTADITLAGRFLGSPRWTSPEALDRHQTVDQRADVYALGLLLYTMLVGAPPFDGDAVQVMHAHLHERPKPMAIRRADGTILPEMEAIVARCLEKEPGRRFAGMDDVLREMREVTAAYGGDVTSTLDLREREAESLDILEESSDGQRPPLDSGSPGPVGESPKVRVDPAPASVVASLPGAAPVPGPQLPAAADPEPVAARTGSPALPRAAVAAVAAGILGLLWLFLPTGEPPPADGDPRTSAAPGTAAPGAVPAPGPFHVRVETDPPGAALALRAGSDWVPLGATPWEGDLPLDSAQTDAEIRATAAGYVEWSGVVSREESAGPVRARLLPDPARSAPASPTPTPAKPLAPPRLEPTPSPRPGPESATPDSAPVPAGYKEDPY